ncbi:MAG: DUF2157 domain-containing protein, partial [Treponema sp.]|nr:DUF2157 domain-containing protein [Treponema sp.]
AAPVMQQPSPPLPPEEGTADQKGPGPSLYGKINRRSAKAKKPPLVQGCSVTSSPVLLSIIAAILIASGIISLIAYNWYAIPRMTKAISAFMLLLAVQAGGVFVSLETKRFAKPVWQEGVSLLWALLFGGVVAYISQVCRLPGNTAAFLLVWSSSSILLTYAMRSVSVFVLSLLLSSAYVVTAAAGEGEPSLFYLLFAALCPFAFRFRFGTHAMLVIAAAMLGFVLEKSIPGLWIVCSVSLAVFALEYALSRDYRKLAALSFTGLCVLLLVLSRNRYWCGIGWLQVKEVRSVTGMLLDSVLAVGLTVTALAWPFVPRLSKKHLSKWQLVYPACALGTAVLFIASSCLPLPLQRSLFLAPTGIVFLLSLLFVVHALFGKRVQALLLLCCLFLAACMVQLNLPVFALAAFLLVIEAAGVCPRGIVRVCTFGLFLLAAACLQTTPAPLYRLFRPKALPLHIALYASYVLGAAVLFVRSRKLSASFDIIASVAAMMLCSLLGFVIPLGKNLLCTAYFCILLCACAYHVVRHELPSREGQGNLSGQEPSAGGKLPAGRSGGEALVYWLPFAAVCAYFSWAAFFVLQLNYPLLAGTSFLLLFVAAAFRRTRSNPQEAGVLGGLIRVCLAVWMAAAFFLCREGLSFAVSDREAVPFQLVSYGCIALAALVLLVWSGAGNALGNSSINESGAGTWSGSWRLWLDTLDSLLALAGVCTVCLLYRGKKTDFPEAFLYLYALAGLYGFIRWRKDGRLRWLPYVLLFGAAGICCLYGVTETFFLCSPFVPFCAALYLYSRERELQAPLANAAAPVPAPAKTAGPLHAAGRLGQLLCIVIIYGSAFVSPRLHVPRNFPLECFLPLLLTLVLYAFMCLLPAVLLVRARLHGGKAGKPRWNFLLALYALIVAVCFLLLLAHAWFAGTAGTGPAFLSPPQIAGVLSYISFAFIFLTAGWYIFEAYTDGSLAKANCCAAYAALALIIKFFSDSYSFVAKGVLFIVLGIAMLLLNLLLLRMDRRKEAEKKLEKEDSHDNRS